MKKPKRKPTVALHMAQAEPRRVLPKGWTLGTVGQWIPVASVAVGGLIWLTQLGDRVTALEKMTDSLAASVWHRTENKQ